MIISGFPGIGKTYLFNTSINNPMSLNLKISDSDSSKFDKDNFPNNYIEHILKIKDEYDIVLVSSHKSVRDELIKRDIPFVLVYPDKELKSIFMDRYKNRGSSEEFIKFMEDNFDKFVDECDNISEEHLYCFKYKLYDDYKLYDIIEKIRYYFFIIYNQK